MINQAIAEIDERIAEVKSVGRVGLQPGRRSYLRGSTSNLAIQPAVAGDAAGYLSITRGRGRGPRAPASWLGCGRGRTRQPPRPGCRELETHVRCPCARRSDWHRTPTRPTPARVDTRTTCIPRVWPPTLCTVTPGAIVPVPSWNWTCPVKTRETMRDDVFGFVGGPQRSVAHAAPGHKRHLVVLQVKARVREERAVAGVVVMQMRDDDVLDRIVTNPKRLQAVFDRPGHASRARRSAMPHRTRCRRRSCGPDGPTPRRSSRAACRRRHAGRCRRNSPPPA